MEFQQKIQMEFEQIPPNHLLVTVVTEVKSHYFRGRGSTMVVAVKSFLPLLYEVYNSMLFELYSHPSAIVIGIFLRMLP